WWPRYGPQLWLLPIVPVAVAMKEEHSRLRVGAACFLLAMLLADAAVVAGVRLHWETVASRDLSRQLHELSSSGKEYDFSTGYFDESIKLRLTKAGVRFHDLGNVKIRGEDLTSMVKGY